MTFRANSMTFRIDPTCWETMPEYKLKEDFEEFQRWYLANSYAMNAKDAAEGRKLLDKMQELLVERHNTKSGKYYVDIDSSSDSGSQLSFFPTH